MKGGPNHNACLALELRDDDGAGYPTFVPSRLPLLPQELTDAQFVPMVKAETERRAGRGEPNKLMSTVVDPPFAPVRTWSEWRGNERVVMSSEVHDASPARLPSPACPPTVAGDRSHGTTTAASSTAWS